MKKNEASINGSRDNQDDQNNRSNHDNRNNQDNENKKNQEGNMNKENAQDTNKKNTSYKSTSTKNTSKAKTSTSKARTSTSNKSTSKAKTTTSKAGTKGSNTNSIFRLLDPSEVDAPGRTNADDYENAVGKFRTVKNTAIIATSKYLHQPTTLEVENMIKHFDARQVDPLKVIRKGSMYELIDGVKTYTVLCELHKRMGIESFDIMCRIYDKLTEEDCARVYAKQDEQHTNLPMGFKLRALEVAQDPEVLEFLDKTRESGFETKPGDSRPRHGYIAAICTAFGVFQNIGAQAYLRMLKIIHKTWAGEKWSVTKHMLTGMSGFLKTHNVDINEFSQMFRHVTYEEIYTKAMEFAGMTRDGAFTSAIADKFAELSANAQNAAAAGN